MSRLPFIAAAAVVAVLSPRSALADEPASADAVTTDPADESTPTNTQSGDAKWEAPVIGIQDGGGWDDPKLQVGDPAPPLNVEHWFGEAKAARGVTAGFSEGQVYVVEFWWTECVPCVEAMPHLAELANANDDVIIIGLSDEDPEVIESFLDRDAPTDDGDENDNDANGQTFRDLTAAYSLGTDPDRSCNRDYLRATEGFGSASAFIIGKTGLVEWMGWSGELDEPLAAVQADTWDRDAFREARASTRRAAQEIGRIAGSYMLTRREAIAQLNEIAETTTDPKLVRNIEWAKGHVADRDVIGRAFVGDPEAQTIVRSRIKQDSMYLQTVVFYLVAAAGVDHPADLDLVRDVVDQLQEPTEYGPAPLTNALYLQRQFNAPVEEIRAPLEAIRQSPFFSGASYVDLIRKVEKELDLREAAAAGTEPAVGSEQASGESEPVAAE